MVEKRKVAGEADEELEKLRAKQRAALSRGMTTPGGQLVQPESTAPRMDPLLLQARNRNFVNRFKEYIETLEFGSPGSRAWNGGPV